MLLILAIMKFILVIRLIRHRECTSLYLRINDIIGGKKVRVKLLKRIPLERLMDLKIDYAFKQLFGIEKNKDIAVVFLNAILQRTGRKRIKDISFTNTEAGGEYKDDRQSRLDLLVVTDANEWINIEIQFSNQYDMVKRYIYYWSGIYRGSIQKKMSYKELNPVIVINILNFNLFNQTDQFHTTYHLYEDKEMFKLTDVMGFHFIEISKLIKDWKSNKLDPWNDVLARWLLMLGMVDRRNGAVHEDIYKKMEVIAMKDETLHSAFKKWEEISLTREQRFAYESRLKRVLDEESAQREAKLRLDEAKVKAMQEGKQEGRQEGIQKGIQEGKQEEKEAIARRLLTKGMDVESIVEVTGLEKERVIEIK